MNSLILSVLFWAPEMSSWASSNQLTHCHDTDYLTCSSSSYKVKMQSADWKGSPGEIWGKNTGILDWHLSDRLVTLEVSVGMLCSFMCVHHPPDSLLCSSLPASSKEEIVHREEEGRDLSPRPQKSERPAGCRWESAAARPPARRHQGTDPPQFSQN